MARIIAPNGDYDGVSASVKFANGVGETDDPHLMEWFRDKGYTVLDESIEGFAAMTVKELKAYAEEKEIDLGEAKKKDEIIAAIEAVEADGADADE